MPDVEQRRHSFSDKLFSGKGLHFQPSVLDFGVQFLGQPAAKILYAYNPSRESEVVVNSVFTAARHFHVPPVHCRVIPAMGKTSFRIIFLPTEEGSIESSLFINTSSHGVLSYHVSGIGTRRVSAKGSAEQLPNAYFLLPQVQSVQLSQTQITFRLGCEGVFRPRKENSSLKGPLLNHLTSEKTKREVTPGGLGLRSALEACGGRASVLSRLQGARVAGIALQSGAPALLRDGVGGVEIPVGALPSLPGVSPGAGPPDHAAVALALLGNHHCVSRRDSLSLAAPSACLLGPQPRGLAPQRVRGQAFRARLPLLTARHQPVVSGCWVEPRGPLRWKPSAALRLPGRPRELQRLPAAEARSDDSAVNMYILHSGNSLIWIQDVHHFSQRDVLSLQFEPVLLPTSTTNFTKIASFTCKAPSCDSGVREDRKKKNTPTLKACLSSPVVQGYFRMDPSATHFHIENHENASGLWSMWYLNHFDHGVVLNDVFVSKETKHILKILNFTGPLFLPPGCWKIFSLKLAVKDIAINLFTHVFLTTNIGAVFAIPLQIYSPPTKEGSLGFEVIAHCGMHYFMGKSKAENPNWEGSLSLDQSTWDVDSELANTLYERWKKLKHGDVCKRTVLGVTRFAHSRKPKESEPFAVFLPRLVPEPGLVLNFSATALRSSMVKYFMVKNPSSWPVSLQLLPVSLYPKPEAAARLLHKCVLCIPPGSVRGCARAQPWRRPCPSVRTRWHAPSRVLCGSSVSSLKWSLALHTLIAFINNFQGVQSEESRFGILHLHLQPLEKKRVGVVFTPADYGKVSSLILIRNNLTVIDMIGVEGFGARELLKVGGRLPGAGGSLRFKVPESTLMDCRRQLKDSKQILSITKSFKVENIGPLPITVTALKINGYNCQGYGFEVLDCHQFSLGPNTSRDISIVFTPDFTSSWVIRELTLVTAAGLEFRFTLNVTLPHHLLPLCADVVPGPSWEESFWRLTVFFVSLSLLGVILIAFQQAQYILMEFMKTRQRQNASSPPQQSTSPVDVISPQSHKSNCKNFLDTYTPSDKGRGKSCLPVSSPQSRIQNATKRSPATYGHSQKKHKCSVYYGKHRGSAAAASSAGAPSEDRPAPAKEDGCPAGAGEAWAGLKCAGGLGVNLQRGFALPKSLLGKDENTPKGAAAASHPSSGCHAREGVQTCMFPKETDFQIAEGVAELQERDVCPMKTLKRLPENHVPRNSPQCPSDLPEVSRKSNGNNQQVPVKNEVDSCETLKKVDTKSSSEKKIHKAAKEDGCSEKQDIASVEQEDPYRKKALQEKKEGNVQNLNWNKNRICRKNKKRTAAQVLRPSDQSELKLVCSEFERSELSSDVNVRNWRIQESPGEACRAGASTGGSLPGTQGEAEGYFPKPGKKGAEKSCSDSGSDCGSSSGSVRASRGSWGSWSSASSSDGDRKPAAGPPRCLLPGDSVSQNDFSSEAPISLNLSHNVCNPTDVSSLPVPADAPCPSLPAGPAATEDQGLCAPGDLWPAQPVCVTGGFGCALENGGPAVLPPPAPVPSSSFIDWNATCEGQFPSVYCPLELNDYNAFPEESVNYPSGFACPAEVQTDFADHSSPSAWGSPTSVPTAWGHASLISSPPYLTSARSLSPMSGLFGSIWAPQSDVYENCCAISPTTEHSAHLENRAVMCKEYYPGFNPFRAYMDLDIWTSTANRNADFPLSRDSSYCGNM
nr:transmembrane protein 131-like [Odocoileus virginianus texanus]